MNNFDKKIEKLFSMIMNAEHLIAFTGAGISTLSGIKDFRGKEGLYKQPNTEDMFNIDVFIKTPSVYYNLAEDFIYGLNKKKPAIVHTVLADLEKLNRVKAIVTQNIDLLHQKAGSKNVLEIHGSPSIHYCIDCGYTENFEEIVKIAENGIVPKCKKCSGVLKPAITFFGEALPHKVFAQAELECKNADLLLILGTSLQVYPAAALPGYTIRNGGKIVIVNDQPTPLDRYAELLFTDLEETFQKLEEKLSIYKKIV